MVLYKFQNYSFQFHRKHPWCFDKDCNKSVGFFGWYSHFNNTNSSKPLTRYIFLSVYLVFNFFHQGLIVFLVQVFYLLREVYSQACVCVSHSVMSNSFQPHGLQPNRLLWPWNSPGKDTGVDCHCLLQRIFPTQESNLSLSHCGKIFY